MLFRKQEGANNAVSGKAFQTVHIGVEAVFSNRFIVL